MTKTISFIAVLLVGTLCFSIYSCDKASARRQKMRLECAKAGKSSPDCSYLFPDTFSGSSRQ